jgi:hypothetical protein
MSPDKITFAAQVGTKVRHDPAERVDDDRDDHRRDRAPRGVEAAARAEPRAPNVQRAEVAGQLAGQQRWPGYRHPSDLRVR